MFGAKAEKSAWKDGSGMNIPEQQGEQILAIVAVANVHAELNAYLTVPVFGKDDHSERRRCTSFQD